MVRVVNYTYTFQTNILGTHGTFCTFFLNKTETAFLEKNISKMSHKCPPKKGNLLHIPMYILLFTETKK